MTEPCEGSSSPQYFQKCRLARAVCADYAVAVAGRKFEIDALEQSLGAEIEAEI